MLARLLFAIALELDTGAVDEQVQGAIGAPIGDLHRQGPLASVQGRIVLHSPVQARHLQQAGHHSRRLPQRQLEQHLYRQTELDRGIRKDHFAFFAFWRTCALTNSRRGKSVVHGNCHSAVIRNDYAHRRRLTSQTNTTSKHRIAQITCKAQIGIHIGLRIIACQTHRHS